MLYLYEDIFNILIKHLDKFENNLIKYRVPFNTF
jgi:hypothetical protein